MANNWDGWDDVNSNSSSTEQNENRENNRSSNNFTSNNKKDRVKDEPPHSEENLGEAPEFPPIFFTYDPIKNKFQVRDKRGNVKSEFDVMTVNGADAYHLWKDGQTAGSDTSYTAYQKDIKGQDGKNGKNAFEEWQDSRDPNTDRSWEAYLKFFKGDNGKSAFEQWKEVHGEYTNPDIDDFFNYFKGQDGKDAYEVWREMGFNGDKQAFFEWLAGLVKAEPGKDGKTYYPHFDGYELYFTEDPEGEKTIIARQNLRGQQGRTYEPKMEGTVLHFDDGEGDKTTPIDLKGKDAFELWKEYHHKPDAKYEEFEDFFKGQNVKSDHSYLDIKDFTCPVQTIDTELIANVLDSAKSPDELVKVRQEDIDNLRKEGDSLTEGLDKKKWHKFFPLSFLCGFMIYKNWAGWFKEFSWWCAGADRPLLRMCKGDHSKYTGIGTVILFTALMAWFSSYIAMRLVFNVSDDTSLFSGGANLAAIGFATFWSLLIFFLDRFITNTMYSDGKVTISKDELLGGLPRILIAIFLGIVISAPLELHIFKTSIDNELVEVLHKEKTEFEKLCRNSKRSEFTAKISKLATEIKTDSLKILNIQGEVTNIETNTKDPYPDSENDAYKINIWNAATQTFIFIFSQNKYDQAVKKWENRHPEYIEKKDRIKDLEDKLPIKKDTLKIWISQVDSIAELYANEMGTKLEEKQDTGLLRRLELLHSLAFKDYTPWFYKENADSILTSSQKGSVHLNDTINSDTINNLKEAEAYVYGASNHPFAVFFDTILHSWWYFLLFTPIGLIMLLFILIDISPVLYKMMLADGVYDNYLHQEKLLAQDKIRLSLARMLRNIEKGELKALSPFIMGKIYRKLMKFSTNASGKYGTEEKDYKQHIKWGETQGLNEEIKKANDDVFRIVLDYKKRIVLASYAAWYRDMRDAMIGAKDDAEGEKINPKSHFQDNERQKVNGTEDSENSSSGDSQSTSKDSEETDSNDNGQ